MNKAPPHIDRRTGRPFGDHGTALRALQFAFDKLHDDVERMDFLREWWHGGPEYPEFYAWLKTVESAGGG